jgi:hypothetical protein
MRHAKMIGYVVGCIGVLTVGAALAKEPAQTAGPALSTPAGCADSMRGRTHVLRFCGDKHYWIKTAAPALEFGPGTGPIYLDLAGSTVTSGAGTSNNWGCCQR